MRKMNWLDGHTTDLEIYHLMSLQSQCGYLEQPAKHRQRVPGSCAAFGNMPFMKQKERGSQSDQLPFKGCIYLA